MLPREIRILWGEPWITTKTITMRNLKNPTRLVFPTDEEMLVTSYLIFGVYKQNPRSVFLAEL